MRTCFVRSLSHFFPFSIVHEMSQEQKLDSKHFAGVLSCWCNLFWTNLLVICCCNCVVELSNLDHHRQLSFWGPQTHWLRNEWHCPKKSRFHPRQGQFSPGTHCSPLPFVFLSLLFSHWKQRWRKGTSLMPAMPATVWFLWRTCTGQKCRFWESVSFLGLRFLLPFCWGVFFVIHL